MRVASLTPSNTEILAFLDQLDHLVACDLFSDWPPEVQQLSSLGPDLQIDVERLREIDADLVLAAESVPGMEHVNEELEQAGLDFEVLAPTSLEDIQVDVQRVADLMGVPLRGDELAEAMEEGIEAIEARLEGVDRVDVYWEWWPDPPITPGSGGWMDEVIARAGGRNVYHHRDEQSLETDLEDLRAQAPDFVGLCWQGTLHAKQSIERLVDRDEGAWGDLDAVRKGRVDTFEEALYGRPGPRIVEGTRTLAAALHPSRADQLPDPYAWLPDALKDPLAL